MGSNRWFFVGIEAGSSDGVVMETLPMLLDQTASVTSLPATYECAVRHRTQSRAKQRQRCCIGLAITYARSCSTDCVGDLLDSPTVPQSACIPTPSLPHHPCPSAF